MACCVITALVMNRLIKACDVFDFRLVHIKYNDDERGSCAPIESEEGTNFGMCRISIDGMTCGACVSSVTKELESLHGVFRVGVSLALGRASVSYDPTFTGSKQLLEAIRGIGYDATLGERSINETIERLRQSQELEQLRVAISSASICATIILALEYLEILSVFDTSPPVVPRTQKLVLLCLAFRVQIWDAWSIHLRAWTGKSRQTATMDTLLSISLLLGICLTTIQSPLQTSSDARYYVSSGSFLTVIILAGKYLEAILRKESNSNLAALYELQTETEIYWFSQSKVAVPGSLLKKGDDILIQPQATIPCDCYILDGSSAINESNITGESLPVVKDVGDFLLAGTKNLSRQLRVIVCKDQSESSLAKIIEGIVTATEQRSEDTEPLGVVMRGFVFGVIFLAGVAFTRKMYQSRHLNMVACFTVACERATTVLAAACPCGIGLATPSAAMAGVDAAYAQGVLLSGGIRTMEALQKATHVVMDKTGTLTQGRLYVTSFQFDESLRLNRKLCHRLLAAAEVDEARIHPVAKAVFKWALSNADLTSTSMSRTRNFTQVLGKGVKCEVNAHSDEWISVHVGTPRFLEENQIVIPQCASRNNSSASMVYFAFDKRYGGRLYVQDTLRQEACYVVDALLKHGLQVTMLTGDTAMEAERISSTLKIPVLGSRALPSDKMQYVKDLQQQGHRVVMVGDGMNDSLAQAAADVGICISLAQDCFSGAGSAVIVSGNLTSVASLFSISKQVVAQAKLNIWWALIYNIVAISIAMGLFEEWGVCITASTAGSMMAFSSISVLSMSLYLRHRLRSESSLPT
ncbi:heavy metal translocatin [Pleomassaria siparia CBS 279.74]|uniref:Heavy metal translocatin n=1 Tax=Pleomassaria siparia CBS 279.74 TaxID=1314801 RepID=A0A6G1KF05_9PLEO|nr:heavy metal translocatin [Pleomassaria siparia CBS 279.74]